ncbi:unnamed protein product, partial [Laminaria digitata]
VRQHGVRQAGPSGPPECSRWSGGHPRTHRDHDDESPGGFGCRAYSTWANRQEGLPRLHEVLGCAGDDSPLLPARQTRPRTGQTPPQSFPRTFFSAGERRRRRVCARRGWRLARW